MKAKKFDRDFDNGKDITGALDLSRARRPKQEQKRANVLPVYLDDDEYAELLEAFRDE